MHSNREVGGLQAGFIQIIGVRALADRQDTHCANVVFDVEPVSAVFMDIARVEQCFSPIGGNAPNLDHQIIVYDHITRRDHAFHKMAGGEGHQRLQAGQVIEIGRICCRGQCRLHSGQVLRRHARDAQAVQICLGGIAVHHVLHRVSQRLQLGRAVDRAGVGGGAVQTGGVQHIAQQAEFWRRIHAIDTHGRILSLGRIVTVVVGCAVSALHDGCVSVYDGLHFRGVVYLRA